MLNAKTLVFIVICTALLLGGSAMAVEKSFLTHSETGKILPKKNFNPFEHRTPSRDYDDDLWTFRFFYSSDGGANWGDIVSLGDLGMWEINALGDTIPAWAENPTTDMGTVIDMDNCLHIIAILDMYNPDAGLNPSGNVNGLYDIMTDHEGNCTMTLIAAEGDMDMFYADAGIDAEGNMYAIWLNMLYDEEGIPSTAEIYATKTTDGENWSEPFMIVDGLGTDYTFAHMTYNVGEYFYVIYQHPTDLGNTHSIAKVPAALEGNVMITDTELTSLHPYYSYKFSSCNPIEFVPQADGFDNGFVYFNTSDEAQAGIHVGFSENGTDWETVHYAPEDSVYGPVARYPSLGMDPVMQMPWIFTNYGVPGSGEYHHSCYIYDELGFNGGSWIVPPMMSDSAMYDGSRFILYCHNAVWTPNGTMVKGVNLWGDYTPESYQVSTYNADDDTWSDPQVLWSIFDEDDPFMGGSVGMNHLLAGTEDNVWIVFGGMYGETDFVPPEVSEETLSSYMIGEPWVVSAECYDATGIVYTDVNWYNEGAEEPGWEWMEADSSGELDPLGNGMYYYTMPSDTMHGSPIAEGDSIWFYVFAQDGSGNYGQGWESLLVAGQAWSGIFEPVEIPTQIELGQNFPNPFNSTTHIPFSIDKPADVSLKIYSVDGRLVDTVYEGRMMAGYHHLSWKAEGVPAGIYFSVLETGGQRLTSKMAMIR